VTDSGVFSQPAQPETPKPAPEEKRPWKVRALGRICLVLSVLLTCFYMRDVPRAFDYMITGYLPKRLNVFWLEYSLRDYYLPGKFARKIVRGALPAFALGCSALLLLVGSVGILRGEHVKVRRGESFVWVVGGTLLFGANAMATWIIWKAFVFL